MGFSRAIMMRFPLFSACVALGLASLAAAPRWTPQSSGGTATLRGVSAVSDTVAWASGSGNTILRTSDGGRTCQPLTVTTDKLDFRDVDGIDVRTAYLLSIGTGPASRIYKTTDAGAHWGLQFTNPDPKGFFDAMTYWDADHGIVVGDSVDGRFSIFLTSDGGRTWTSAPLESLPPALSNEGAFAASGTNVAVYGSNDVWFGTGAGPKARVLHSPDRGHTWTVAETPLPSGRSSGIFSVAFRDATHGVVVGGDYAKEKEAVHALSRFRSVVAYVPREKMSLIAVGPQGADWSTDDGRTWTPIECPGFHTFSFSTTGAVGWGAGGRGALARFDR
jgi:photosystem II stability/assembly factor-like uncharacterized protein